MAMIVCRCPVHGGEFYFDEKTFKPEFTMIWKCEKCDYNFKVKKQGINVDVIKSYDK